MQPQCLQDVLINVAPQKANWDLRRDIADKLARLERRTQASCFLAWFRARLVHASSMGLLPALGFRSRQKIGMLITTVACWQTGVRQRCEWQCNGWQANKVWPVVLALQGAMMKLMHQESERREVHQAS